MSARTEYSGSSGRILAAYLSLIVTTVVAPAGQARPREFPRIEPLDRAIAKSSLELGKGAKSANIRNEMQQAMEIKSGKDVADLQIFIAEATGVDGSVLPDGAQMLASSANKPRFSNGYARNDVPKQLAPSSPQSAGRANTQQTRVPGSHGQQKRQPAGSSADDKRQQALKARQTDDLKRLNQLVDDAYLIGDPAARSRLLARVADAVWSHDKARARSLFKDAFDEAINIPKPNEQEGKRLTCGLVRIDVTRLLAKHDARLASEQILNSVYETDCDYGARNRASSEHPRSELLATTAQSLVTRDPYLSYRLGLKSLQDGITSPVGELLRQLSVKNKELAEQLLSACIERISSKDVNALEIHYVADFLFQDEISPDRKQRAKAKVEERADLKAAYAKKFLEASFVATDRFVAKIERQHQGKEYPANRVTDPGIQQVWTPEADVKELAASYYSMMLNLLEGVRSYDRDKLPGGQALLQRLGRWMDPVSRDHMLVFYYNGDTPESLVAEAEKTIDAGKKRELYELASELAQQKGDEKKALELAAKIDDESDRYGQQHARSTRGR